MGSVPPLLSFLLIVVSGWVHRHQLTVIEFLQAENRLLKQKLRGKRLRFTDAERTLLARKAKAVGRKALLQLETIVSPDTLLRFAAQWSIGVIVGAARTHLGLATPGALRLASCGVSDGRYATPRYKRCRSSSNRTRY